MTTSTSPPRFESADDAERAEFRLLVWISPTRGWHARIVGADAAERDFASPFELARFVAWPGVGADADRPGRRRGPGLR